MSLAVDLMSCNITASKDAAAAIHDGVDRALRVTSSDSEVHLVAVGERTGAHLKVTRSMREPILLCPSSRTVKQGHERVAKTPLIQLSCRHGLSTTLSLCVQSA
eukprot:48451-Rhodomonas_salina.3